MTEVGPEGLREYAGRLLLHGLGYSPEVREVVRQKTVEVLLAAADELEALRRQRVVVASGGQGGRVSVGGAVREPVVVHADGDPWRRGAASGMRVVDLTVGELRHLVAEVVREEGGRS